MPAEKPNTDELARRFGENLLQLRRTRHLSQTALADQTGMHRNDISLIERGRRRPRVDVLIKVATILEVTPADLLNGIAWVPRKRPQDSGEFRVDFDPPRSQRTDSMPPVRASPPRRPE